jgi:hypothetical protein
LVGGDHGRAVGLPRLFQRSGDRLWIMAVDAQRVPAGGFEALGLVGGVGQRDGAVDRDVVVVPDEDQLGKAQMARQSDRLLADAFHQAAVAGKHIGVVVDDVVAVACIEDALGERHADGVGDALSKRAGRGLDPAGMAEFGVAGRARAELAEVPDLVDRDVFIARQIKQRIKQHRAVSGRQHEAVAVGPVRMLGIVLHEACKQHGSDVGCAHGQAGMARIRLFDRVHREEADGVRHLVMLFACRHHPCFRAAMGWKCAPEGARDIAGAGAESTPGAANAAADCRTRQTRRTSASTRHCEAGALSAP